MADEGRRSSDPAADQLPAPGLLHPEGRPPLLPGPVEVAGGVRPQRRRGFHPPPVRGDCEGLGGPLVRQAEDELELAPELQHLLRRRHPELAVHRLASNAAVGSNWTKGSLARAQGPGGGWPISWIHRGSTAGREHRKYQRH